MRAADSNPFPVRRARSDAPYPAEISVLSLLDWKSALSRGRDRIFFDALAFFWWSAGAVLVQHQNLASDLACSPLDEET